MKIKNFNAMLEQIELERGIKKENIIAALEEALLTAVKKRYGDKETLKVKITDKGETKITDDGKEITLSDFGRLAAITAKQVIIQRIREAEKGQLFEEYGKKAGQLINGTIKKKEGGGYLVNIGKIETYLSHRDCIPGDNLRTNDRVKMLVLEVRRGSKGPDVIVTRSHSDFIKKLFEMEVAEIESGVLEIKGVAREAGRRTKIAIKTNDPNVGVIGTCVGQMGSRIQNVTREISGERIDIIEWSDDPHKYIKAALSPAKPIKIEIAKQKPAEEGQPEPILSAKVILPEKELSLAIGKEGQNVRLASKLTGYNLDIVSAGEKDTSTELGASEGRKREERGVKDEGRKGKKKTAKKTKIKAKKAESEVEEKEDAGKEDN